MRQLDLPAGQRIDRPGRGCVPSGHLFACQRRRQRHGGLPASELDCTRHVGSALACNICCAYLVAGSSIEKSDADADTDGRPGLLAAGELASAATMGITVVGGHESR